MSPTWTPELDTQLLKMREAGKTWRVITLTTRFGKTACQRRYEFLKNGPVVQAAPVRTPGRAALPRDGLQWLSSRKRLTARQVKAGVSYRTWFRDAGGPALKSSLNVIEGGGGPGSRLPPALEGLTDAKSRLFRVRHQVLKGQPDMVTVLDAVCGVGLRLTELAGDDRHRVKEFEAVLRIALDLIAAHLEDAP